jgi:hypothetical protein
MKALLLVVTLSLIAIKTSAQIDKVVDEFEGTTTFYTPLLEPASITKVIEKNKTFTYYLSLTTTGLTNTQIANTYLSKVFPAVEHQNDTICRVVCTDTGAVTIRQFQLLSGTWTYQFDL